MAGAARSKAPEVKPCTAAALAAAQQSGLPVALHLRADGCTTGRAQDQRLEAKKTEKGLDLTVLDANDDIEKDLKRQCAIRTQAMLVVLRGHKESARSIGDTTLAGLRTALKSAL